jgi:3-deoxy-D-manno-octulosonic-acid transferase
METELWPNLLAACAHRGIPVVLASARLSARSMGWYRRLAPLLSESLARVVIGAQTKADAERFRALGAAPGRTHVTGNAKFDVEAPPEDMTRARAMRAAYAPHRPLWIAGSTHDGEEALVLDAHVRVRAAHPDALLLLVPRHPPRFDAVADLLARRGLPFVRRSSGAQPDAACQVVLGDTLGELAMLYGAADVAFVGGSLAPIGGHNLLEPAAQGVAVVTGPHNSNGREVLDLLLAAGAARVVGDAAALGDTVTDLLADAQGRDACGAAGRRVVAGQRGSVRRLLALVEQTAVSAGSPES